MGKLPSKVQIIVIALMGVFLFFGGVKYQEIRLNKLDLEIVGTFDLTDVIQSAAGEEEVPTEIVVHVVGAVEKPGVYTFLTGARVAEAIQEAIPLANADLGQLNLALLLQDGKQIDVPYREKEGGNAGVKTATPVKTNGFAQVTPADKIGGVAQEGGGKINLNTASQSELMTLPQIGAVIASRIIEYRQQKGAFQKIEDLLQISGIGEVTFAKLKELITVD